MSHDPKQLDYVDALRGYAIFGVIAVHASQQVPDLEPPWRLLVDQGARGVQLFFVVSALTLMMSMRERHDGVMAFYIRRLFRIAPMFWLAIILFPIVDSLLPAIRYWPPLHVNSTTVLASLTFTFGLNQATLASIVPGGWSIADEMTFYLLLPLLAAWLLTWRSSACVLVGALAVAALTYAAASRGFLFAAYPHDQVMYFAYLWFPTQFPAFLVGILVFHLLREFSGRVPLRWLCALLTLSVLGMVALPLIAAALQAIVPFVMYFMVPGYALLFGTAVFCIAQGAGRLLVTGVARHVGKVSYSAYFLHFPMLGIIHAAIAPLLPRSYPVLDLALILLIATTATVLVASLTYRFVEVPMIRIGRQLAAAWTDRRRPSAAPFGAPVDARLATTPDRLPAPQ